MNNLACTSVSQDNLMRHSAANLPKRALRAIGLAIAAIALTPLVPAMLCMCLSKLIHPWWHRYRKASLATCPRQRDLPTKVC